MDKPFICSIEAVLVTCVIHPLSVTKVKEEFIVFWKQVLRCNFSLQCTSLLQNTGENMHNLLPNKFPYKTSGIVKPFYWGNPEMRTPLYLGHLQMSQTVLYNINSPWIEDTRVIRRREFVPSVSRIEGSHCIHLPGQHE